MTDDYSEPTVERFLRASAFNRLDGTARKRYPFPMRPGLWSDDDVRTWRRLGGYADDESSEFVLDGLVAERWFNALDLPAANAAVQEQCAEFFVQAVAEDGEARIGRGPISYPPHTEMIAWHTCIFVRVKEMSKLKAAVTTGLIAGLLTHNPPTALTATVLATLWNNVKRLDESELEIIRIMQRMTDGDVYEAWTSYDDLVEAIPPSTEGKSAQQSIASMQSRGILEESAGLWRVVK